VGAGAATVLETELTARYQHLTSREDNKLTSA
jgi:hypothetical protein